MLNVVAKRLLGEVSWGLKLRVTMGAGLSLLDMATDIFVIVGYMGNEETRGYGWNLLGMVLASMAVQLLIVFGAEQRKAVGAGERGADRPYRNEACCGLSPRLRWPGDGGAPYI